MTGKLAAKSNQENGTALRMLLNQYGVKQYLNSKVVEFTEAGVVIEREGGRCETLPADTAIVALGTRGRKSAADAIKAKYPKAWIVGDCTGEVGLVGDAMHDAYEAVWQFEGDIKKKQAWLKKREKDAKFRTMLSSRIMPHK